MWPLNPLSAARWRSCRPGISLPLMWRPGSFLSIFPNGRWCFDRKSGGPRCRSSSGVTAPCTASTSPRPTKAATSTSWPGGAAIRNPIPGKRTVGELMIQGLAPPPAEPVGEPVAETSDADLDAIVAAATAAFPAWSAFGRRADALEAVADALDARAFELATIADTETALGGERLTGEVGRATGQLRMFAAVLRDGGYHDAVVTAA